MRTDADAATFAAELGKLLAWAGKGGRIRAADVEANVEDESSEDVYGLLRRDRPAGRGRRARSGSSGSSTGGTCAQGDRAFEKIEDIWPIQLFGMIAGEVRRMLLLRARLDEAGPGGFNAAMSYATFQARVLPRLLAPAAPYRPLAVRRREGAAPSLRPLQGGPARVPVQLAGARARPRAGGRRGRAAEDLGAGGRDDLGVRGGADRRSGFEAPLKTRGTAPLLRSPPCLWGRSRCLT